MNNQLHAETLSGQGPLQVFHNNLELEGLSLLYQDLERHAQSIDKKELYDEVKAQIGGTALGALIGVKGRPSKSKFLRTASSDIEMACRRVIAVVATAKIMVTDAFIVDYWLRSRLDCKLTATDCFLRGDFQRPLETLFKQHELVYKALKSANPLERKIPQNAPLFARFYFVEVILSRTPKKVKRQLQRVYQFCYRSSPNHLALSENHQWLDTGIGLLQCLQNRLGPGWFEGEFTEKKLADAISNALGAFFRNSNELPFQVSEVEYALVQRHANDALRKMACTIYGLPSVRNVYAITQARDLNYEASQSGSYWYDCDPHTVNVFHQILYKAWEATHEFCFECQCDFIRVKLAQGRLCALCGGGGLLHSDHVIAVELGGLHEETNVRALCTSCYNKKRHKDHVAWVQDYITTRSDITVHFRKAMLEKYADGLFAQNQTADLVAGSYWEGVPDLSDGALTIYEWQQIVLQQGGRCNLCGESKPLTADHIVPRSAGGDDRAKNVQGLCGPCNSMKGTFSWDVAKRRFIEMGRDSSGLPTFPEAG